jgi:hypothetical protein
VVRLLWASVGLFNRLLLVNVLTVHCADFLRKVFVIHRK